MCHTITDIVYMAGGRSNEDLKLRFQWHVVKSRGAASFHNRLFNFKRKPDTTLTSIRFL